MRGKPWCGRGRGGWNRNNERQNQGSHQEGGDLNPPIKKESNLPLEKEEDIEATFVEEDVAPTLQEEARVTIVGRMVMWRVNVT